MSKPAPSPIATALGRIPSGLYVVTSRSGERPIGFLGSFVQQVGFQPPVVCVAFGKERGHLDACLATGHFGVSILDSESHGLMRAFLRKLGEGETPFDGLNVVRAGSGSPVLGDALAWLDCRIRGRHDAGDHIVVFGEVIEASVQRAGDPSIHLRKNGLSY